MFKKIEESVQDVTITQRNLDIKMEYKGTGAPRVENYFNQQEEQNQSLMLCGMNMFLVNKH
jgi:hypothetical protein